jgi:hypothetical protein
MRCAIDVTDENKYVGIVGLLNLVHKYLDTPVLLVFVFLNLFRHSLVVTVIPQTT